MTRILCLGDNTVDTYVEARVQYPGGNAVNVAAMAARLGASSGYLGCVGDDEGGQLVRNALAVEGVDISHVRVRAGANARAYIGHVDGDRHFIHSEPGVRADYRLEEMDFRYISRFEHVHSSIHSDLGDDLHRIASCARSLSFDASDGWDGELLRRIALHARFIFLSAADLGIIEALAVAEFCLELGTEVIVLTQGSAGALGVASNGHIFQPALPTTGVDTLGAGDGFIAGFLKAKLRGRSLKESMAKGAEVASKVCEWSGGFGHGAAWHGDPPIVARSA